MFYYIPLHLFNKDKKGLLEVGNQSQVEALEENWICSTASDEGRSDSDIEFSSVVAVAYDADNNDDYMFSRQLLFELSGFKFSKQQTTKRYEESSLSVLFTQFLRCCSLNFRELF